MFVVMDQRLIISVMLCFCILLPVGAIHAQTPASLLINLCQAPYDTDQGFCAGYLTAMRDSMNDYQLYGYQTCGGAGVGPQQLADNFSNFMTDRPNPPRQSASQLSAQFLADQFSCQ
jgi:hypothetical protein